MAAMDAPRLRSPYQGEQLPLLVSFVLICVHLWFNCTIPAYIVEPLPAPNARFTIASATDAGHLPPAQTILGSS